jgi:hypothetical protein
MVHTVKKKIIAARYNVLGHNEICDMCVSLD